MGGGGGGGGLRVNLVLRFGPNLKVSLLALALDQAEQFSHNDVFKKKVYLSL